MESDRRLKKVCPQCDTTVHARRAVCVCGHTFPSKRKAQCIAKKEAMKLRRTLETEEEKFARTEQDRLYVNRAQGQLKHMTKFQPGEEVIDCVKNHKSLRNN